VRLDHGKGINVPGPASPPETRVGGRWRGRGKAGHTRISAVRQPNIAIAPPTSIGLATRRRRGGEGVQNSPFSRGGNLCVSCFPRYRF
jgi:hypothetical protein